MRNDETIARIVRRKLSCNLIKVVSKDVSTMRIFGPTGKRWKKIGVFNVRIFRVRTWKKILSCIRCLLVGTKLREQDSRFK